MLATRIALPSLPTPDGVAAQMRGDSYGAMNILNVWDRNALRREGCYFNLTNPTLDTGAELCGDTQTAFDATLPSLLWYNASATKYVYMDYIRLICTQAGSGLSSLQVAFVTDNGNRYSSGGQSLASTIFTSYPGSTASACTVYNGTSSLLATAATSAAVRIARSFQTANITVAKATYAFVFGRQVTPFSAVGGHFTLDYPAFVIPPLGSGLFYMWAGSMSDAPDFEYDAGWIEK